MKENDKALRDFISDVERRFKLYLSATEMTDAQKGYIIACLYLAISESKQI